MGGARLQWWAFAMIPFCYVVYQMGTGLEEGTKKSPPAIASLIRKARWLTMMGWLTYPCVYLIKTGVPGPTPTTLEQIGYSIADVVEGGLRHHDLGYRAAKSDNDA